MTDTTIRQQTAQANAYQRARQQAELGNAPVLVATTVNTFGIILETWRVMSRSAEAFAYYVEVADNGTVVRTTCTCAAGQADKCCWHRGSVRLARQGDVPCENEAGLVIRHKPQAPAITAAMLSGKA